jgi:ATP-binding cassette subfamily B (MDR/TAP) protein 1
MSERGFSAVHPTMEHSGQPIKTVASWRALFNFTDRTHFFILVPALFLSALSGILLPAVAIFMGKYFDALTSYGAGQLSDDELVHKVLFSTYGLVLVGAATWLLKGGYFTLWLVFGEMQAKSVRDKLFQSLLLKDLEWFEMRSSGVGSLLSRLQTHALRFRCYRQLR